MTKATLKKAAKAAGVYLSLIKITKIGGVYGLEDTDLPANLALLISCNGFLSALEHRTECDSRPRSPCHIGENKRPTHPCRQNNQRYKISYRKVLHSLGYVSRK